MRKLLAFWCLLFIGAATFGQLYEVPLQQRIDQASLIVEGRVLESKCNWDAARHNIYTSYLVEVAQVLKGNSPTETIEIVTLGGQVGDDAMVLSHGLSMAPGNYGILFLQATQRFPAQYESRAYKVYAASQGFIRFQNGNITDPFHRYQDPTSEIYARIPGCPVAAPHPKAAPDLQAVPVGRTDTLGIDSIYPLTLTAGTRDTLFIAGTEFGDSTGRVSFTNADDGGLTMFATAQEDILSWTDTLVKVFVPSIGPVTDVNAGTAGTGAVQLETTAGGKVLSMDSIVVRFAINNQRSIGDGTANYRYISDSDSLGGITFRLDSTFSSDTLALPVFEKALRNWRCLTGINLKIGADTSMAPYVEDGMSHVRWAIPADSLSAGQLGLTVTRRQPCVDSTLRLLHAVVEIDIIFRDTNIMHFDTVAPPDSTQTDFYSLAMHELGHGHLLMHVIDPPSLMHFGRPLGDFMRTVDPEQVNGATWVIDSSTTVHPFCLPPMVAVNPLNCSNLNSIQGEMGQNGILSGLIYPNPTLGDFFIQMELENGNRFQDVKIYDATGRELELTKGQHPRAGSIHVPIKLRSKPRGMIFVVVFTSKGSEIFKLIAQ